MDIVFIRTFLAAAETGSFASAALRVHASASSVTDRIQTLEHSLGVRLFDRSKRGCTLTAAGRRFVEPAQTIIRGWEDGQHEVSLPARFTSSISLGGQYALWADRLVPWLEDVRGVHPDLAIRAIAASPSRLNRKLAEGAIDIAFLYDPVFRDEIATEVLFEDKLILVTADPTQNWRDTYVSALWGESVDAEIACRLDGVTGAGLAIDLGLQARHWILAQRASGYLPESLIATELQNGMLYKVAEAPEMPYPVYVCWRKDMDHLLGSELIATARKYFGSVPI